MSNNHKYIYNPISKQETIVLERSNLSTIRKQELHMTLIGLSEHITWNLL